MNHHPHHFRTSSVASLITGQLGHFWKADPGQFSKAPKLASPGGSSEAEKECSLRLWQELFKIESGTPPNGTLGTLSCTKLHGGFIIEAANAERM